MYLINIIKMRLKPYRAVICCNRPLKQTAKKSDTIEFDAYSLPFTLVNGSIQLYVNGGFNPILTIII